MVRYYIIVVMVISDFRIFFCDILEKRLRQMSQPFSLRISMKANGNYTSNHSSFFYLYRTYIYIYMVITISLIKPADLKGRIVYHWLLYYTLCILIYKSIGIYTVWYCIYIRCTKHINV